LEEQATTELARESENVASQVNLGVVCSWWDRLEYLGCVIAEKGEGEGEEVNVKRRVIHSLGSLGNQSSPGAGSVKPRGLTSPSS
jgi:hypothetical protein